MSEVDLYIARFGSETQQRLRFIRQAGLGAFGEVEERLCHSLPAFAKDGKVFMFYGAYKNHISICVGYDWVDFLKAQYPQFHYTQATITFRHKDPFPEEVVRVICGLFGQALAEGNVHAIGTM